MEIGQNLAIGLIAHQLAVKASRTGIEPATTQAQNILVKTAKEIQ
jgi:hypothetical protein